MASGWSQIVKDEQAYMDAVAVRLKELEASASSNMAMEEIYAAVWQAYDLGMRELVALHEDLTSIDKSVQSGQLSQHHVEILSRNNVPQPRWIAALQVLGCMRCLRLPSSVFRQELNRQSSVLIGKFQSLLRDSSFVEDDLTHDLHVMAMTLCSFISMNESSAADVRQAENEPFWKGFMTPQALAVGAAAAGVTYWFTTKKKVKEEQVSQSIEAPEAEESELLGEGEPVNFEEEVMEDAQ